MFNLMTSLTKKALILQRGAEHLAGGYMKGSKEQHQFEAEHFNMAALQA